MTYLYNMKKIVRITENDIVSIVEKVLLENRRFKVRHSDGDTFNIGGKNYEVKFFSRDSDGNPGEEDIEQVSFTINDIEGSENVFGVEPGKQLYGYSHNPKKYKEIIGIEDSAHYDELVGKITDILHDHLGGKGDWKLPKLNA